MLNIYFGVLEDQIKRPDHYLDLIFEEDWFKDPFVQKICKEVDNTEVQSAYQMYNPFFGPINVTKLSTGCKNTILAYKTDRIIPATYMGDNCAPFICEIAQNKDLTITLEYIMDFSRCSNFQAYIINIQKQVNSYKEYVWEAVELL